MALSHTPALLLTRLLSPPPPTFPTPCLRSYRAYDLSGCVVLRNKPPRWNEVLGAYCLSFGGRVTQASVKNFQLVAVDNMVGQLGTCLASHAGRRSSSRPSAPRPAGARGAAVWQGVRRSVHNGPGLAHDAAAGAHSSVMGHRLALPWKLTALLCAHLPPRPLPSA